MVKLGLLLWGLFFILLGFSMFPGYISFVIVISFIGGLIDGIQKNKKRNKEIRNRKPDFKLDPSERIF